MRPTSTFWKTTFVLLSYWTLGASLAACTKAECLRESDCKGGYDCYVGICKRVAPLPEGGVVIVWVDPDAAVTQNADAAPPPDASAPTGPNVPDAAGPDASADASIRKLLDGSVGVSTDSGP